MFRDFLQFLRALWDEWKALLTGGSLVAALELWNKGLGKPLPQRMDSLLIGLTLMLAGFLSWRRQWVANARGLIDIAPADLTAAFKDRTAVQARTVLKQYLNKRLKVSGTLVEVIQITALPPIYHVYLNVDDRASVSFTFLSWNGHPYSMLTVGTRVTIIGRIVGVSQVTVQLKGCELVRIHATVPEPRNPIG